MPLMPRKDPPLVLAPILVLVVEQWGYPGMHAIFTMGLSQLLNRKIKRMLYEEQRMMTTRMDELHNFTECFRLYEFNKMLRAPGKYSEVLI